MFRFSFVIRGAAAPLRLVARGDGVRGGYLGEVRTA